MIPEITLFKPPEGAECLALPEGLDAVRPHIITAVTHLMKLYGLKSIRLNLDMFGPCGVASPSFEVDAGFAVARPKRFDATTSSMVRSMVPLMTAYGVLGLQIRYEDQDRVQVLELWSKIAKEKNGKEKASV